MSKSTYLDFFGHEKKKIGVIIIIYIATYFTVFLYDLTKMKPEEKPYD